MKLAEGLLGTVNATKYDRHILLCGGPRHTIDLLAHLPRPSCGVFQSLPEHRYEGVELRGIVQKAKVEKILSYQVQILILQTKDQTYQAVAFLGRNVCHHPKVYESKVARGGSEKVPPVRISVEVAAVEEIEIEPERAGVNVVSGVGLRAARNVGESFTKIEKVNNELTCRAADLPSTVSQF